VDRWRDPLDEVIAAASSHSNTRDPHLRLSEKIYADDHRAPSADLPIFYR